MNVAGQGPAIRSARRHPPRKRAAISVATVGQCLAIAGCGEQRLADSELVTATRSLSVDPGRAMIVLPPGSQPVIGITQRSYENATAQTISLATRGRTPGENTIQVAFFTAADLPDSAGVEGNDDGASTLGKQPVQPYPLALHNESLPVGVLCRTIRFMCPGVLLFRA